MKNNKLLQDLIIIAFGIVLTGYLVKTGFINALISPAEKFRLLGSFFAGLFYTSAFTTAPAIVVLGKIAQDNSVFWTAFFGAIGASTVDLLIFEFIRNRFALHINGILKEQRWHLRLKTFHSLRLLRWLTFIIAGLIIASPLNFLGILIIWIIAKSIL